MKQDFVKESSEKIDDQTLYVDMIHEHLSFQREKLLKADDKHEQRTRANIIHQLKQELKVFRTKPESELEQALKSEIQMDNKNTDREKESKFLSLKPILLFNLSLVFSILYVISDNILHSQLFVGLTLITTLFLIKNLQLTENTTYGNNE